MVLLGAGAEFATTPPLLPAREIRPDVAPYPFSEQSQGLVVESGGALAFVSGSEYARVDQGIEPPDNSIGNGPLYGATGWRPHNETAKSRPSSFVVAAGRRGDADYFFSILAPPAGTWHRSEVIPLLPEASFCNAEFWPRRKPNRFLLEFERPYGSEPIAFAEAKVWIDRYTTTDGWHWTGPDSRLRPASTCRGSRSFYIGD